MASPWRPKSASDLRFYPRLRRIDIFSMTHHVECVAILKPVGNRI